MVCPISWKLASAPVFTHTGFWPSNALRWTCCACEGASNKEEASRLRSRPDQVNKQRWETELFGMVWFLCPMVLGPRDGRTRRRRRGFTRIPVNKEDEFCCGKLTGG